MATEESIETQKETLNEVPNDQLNDQQTSFLSYEAPHHLYSLGFSNNRNSSFKVAIGSYLEQENNSLTILEVPQTKDHLKEITTINHPYPPTKIKFHPDQVK